MTSGKQTDLILLDFSKAFDKVNHLKTSNKWCAGQDPSDGLSPSLSGEVKLSSLHCRLLHFDKPIGYIFMFFRSEKSPLFIAGQIKNFTSKRIFNQINELISIKSCGNVV